MAVTEFRRSFSMCFQTLRSGDTFCDGEGFTGTAPAAGAAKCLQHPRRPVFHAAAPPGVVCPSGISRATSTALAEWVRAPIDMR